jgi:uncharacterized protein (DUF302 family)
MKKTITPFAAQLVAFDTTLPVREVVTRLDKAVNKSGSAQFLSQFKTVTSKAEIEELVQTTLGENDFLYVVMFKKLHARVLLWNRYFRELSHDQWLTTHEGHVHPVAVVYTIGNPLIAQLIMQHDIRAGYMVPLRLMILEKAIGTGTNVIYHLPSSVMALTNNLDLKAVLEGLDEKLENLVSSISAD